MSDALIAPHTINSLVRLLGMLGSHHDGERAAAAKMAHELVHSLNLTWADVIRLERVPSKSSQQDLADEQFNLLRANLHRLTNWEQDFVCSADRYRHRLTAKQKTVVERLVEKVRRCCS
jgi:hypothetical protein